MVFGLQHQLFYTPCAPKFVGTGTRTPTEFAQASLATATDNVSIFRQPQLQGNYNLISHSRYCRTKPECYGYLLGSVVR
ncbi:hypothetical protein AX14_009765 [Amanita brunnescens Koide BX004]|nr:hypothetical protein AX14_009765 [Amanita brunnescens Koide BX004]